MENEITYHFENDKKTLLHQYESNKNKAIDYIVNSILEVDMSIPQVLKGSTKI